MTFPSAKGIFLIFFIAVFQQSLANSFINTESACQQVAISNGYIKYTTQGIQKFSYNCGNGFTPFGKTISVCYNGQWSNPNPSCIEQNSVKQIENGYLTNSGSTYTITCNSGFTIVGNKEISPEFTNLPACVSVSGITNIQNGNYNIVNNGRIMCIYMCNEGYKLSGSNQIIYENNRWIGSPPTCVQEETTLNIQLENGIISRFGNIYIANCNEGYVLSGNKEITLNDLTNLPTCVKIEIFHNIHLENGLFEVLNNGHTYKFKCFDGYYLKGDSQINYANKQWSGAVPLCLPVKCSSLTIDNGIVKTNMQSNVARFGCCDGFKLEGPTESTCINGLWNNPTPVCTLMCQPINLLNGVIYFEQKTQVAKFTCNNGYFLIGNQQSACHNGKWTQETPVCMPDCPALQFDNGHYTAIESKKTFQFTCNSGFELKGNNEISCNFGQWNYPAPVCVAPCQ